jgi:hypothetical protein
MVGIDLNDADESIIDVLEEGRNTPSNIARELGYSREYVSQRLRRLREHSIVNRIDRGLYGLAEAARGESEPDPGDGASREPEPAPEPDEPDAGDPLAALSFPSGVDHDDGVAAILAARDYLQEHDGATMRQIVLEVMPEHPLKYDPPESLETGDRYRGAWWRNVVKPGLEALEDVEKPGRGGSEWKYVGGADA